MDSNIYEKDLLSNPDKLCAHLSDRIEEIGRTLDDEEDFCNKDIDATIQYIEKMERKFHEKTEKLKADLEKIRLENKTTSEINKQEYQNKMQEINDSFIDRKHYEALKRFQDYEKSFKQRSVLMDHIPKLHMNDSDMEKFFSPKEKPTIQSTNVTPPIIATTQSSIITTSTIATIASADNKMDSTDGIKLSMKEQLRTKKVFENIVIGKNDEDDNEVNNEKKHEQEDDRSVFGIRSKNVENLQTTMNGTIRDDTKSPLSNGAAPRRYAITTRLNPTPSSKNSLVSGRGIPVPPSTKIDNLKSRDNHGHVRSTPTPPHSICSSNPGQITSIKDGKFENIFLNPVSLYQLERNKFLLMTCSTQYIIIFKSQLNRLDRWSFGAIERRSHIEHNLDWHDGLIISMGYIGNNNIYMFTEREFFMYSLNNFRKMKTLMLAQGNDDGSEISSHPYDEPQRAIGTVYDKYMYHIALNRKSNWILSRHLLDTLARMGNYDLTSRFPEVQRFIHICVNDQTISFLVQMNDSAYAVVFCALNDCIPLLMKPIILYRAQHPLTIYSAFIKPLKKYFFFINDPSIDIMHILTQEEYLQSYSVNAHAISYIADSQELMVVTNNSISSMNLNEQNLSFS